MESWYDLLIQAIGFLGVLFFFISFQMKTNNSLFIMQTLGCLTFSVQFALLGALSGCLSLLINIIRNMMLTKYNDYKMIRWKGWIVVFSTLSFVTALFTWNGWVSILPVAGTVAGTTGYWTNNAKIMILDDHSRMIVGGRLFYQENAANFQQVFKAAVGTYRIPHKLYTDYSDK